MRLLATLLLAGFAAGQTPLPVTSFDVTWTNATGVGSAVLATRVFMPVVSAVGDDAVSAGTTALAPATMPARGWPTIVFLHGFGLQGRDYGPLCMQLASQGLLVLAPDTGVYDHVTLTHDALANVDAALVASGDPASPLHGMVDVGRLGVAGHSMGAACMAIAMTANPGFRCAYAIAPVSPFGYLPAVVDVPVGVAVGAGDAITSWSQHALPFYDQSTPRSGMKMIHCFDASSTHMSIAGFTGDTADFARTADICAGFFRHFLGVDDGGMERCIGPAVFADPTLVTHEQTVVESRIWPAAPPRIGQLTRVSVAAASGSLAILVADGLTTGLPTVYGTLLLDPAVAFAWAIGSASRGRRMDAVLAVPNAPSLIGLSMAMQPLAPTSSAAIRFGDATAFVVGP
jgi:dienelactone hydrolase